MRFLIPEGGVSADRPARASRSTTPTADRALFEAIERRLPRRRRTASSMRLPLHINDQAFADALVAALREIASARGAARRALTDGPETAMARIARQTILDSASRA